MSKTSIGGERLGSGQKEAVYLKNFNRSTHDLSYMWRSSASSGTLIPFMNQLALPGDTWDLNLMCDVKTLPTIGPLFGSYKIQLDVFQVPIRLYHKKLMQNTLGIGMDMGSVRFPQYALTAEAEDMEEFTHGTQVNTSSLYRYLGISGVGIGYDEQAKEFTEVNKGFNAVPLLAYFEIYKNYYANKQEEDAYVIHTTQGTRNFTLDRARILEGSQIIRDDVDKGVANLELVGNSELIMAYTVPNGINPEDINLGEIYIQLNEGTREGLRGKFRPTQIWRETDINITTGGTEINIRFFNIRPEFGTEYNWFKVFAPLPEIGASDVIPHLTAFPLENVDKMRLDIMKTEDFVFRPDLVEYPPYSWINNNGIGGRTQKGTQELLAVKCYQSDLFNNWMSQEWWEGTTGINALASVEVNNDSFTIDSLNLANKVYNMLNRIAISGGSYDDWLDAVYTHERRRGVDNPVYQGSLIQELAFEEVVSNASTSGNPLGTLAGRGALTNKRKGGKMKIKVDEPSIIMGIFSLTPRVCYSQGNDWINKLTSMAELHVPSLDEIGFQDLMTDQMAFFGSWWNQSGWVERSAGKQPAWLNYMTNVDKSYGNFAEESEMFMTLNRNYEYDEENYDIADLTTYIDPSKFNNIFADERIDAQNFWVQIKCDIKARRKMSAKVIPNL